MPSAFARERAMSLLLVGLGGGLGAMARYLLALALAPMAVTFPWATLAANVTGSAAMGLLAAWLVRSGDPAAVRLLVGTGLLGGFTTFSTFSLETVALWERGEVGLAIGYASLSLLLAVAGLLCGLALGRAIL